MSLGRQGADFLPCNFKIKVLRNKHVTQRPVIVERSVTEVVQSYIYLGQRVSLVETDMEIK